MRGRMLRIPILRISMLRIREKDRQRASRARRAPWGKPRKKNAKKKAPGASETGGMGEHESDPDGGPWWKILMEDPDAQEGLDA